MDGTAIGGEIGGIPIRVMEEPKQIVGELVRHLVNINPHNTTRRRGVVEREVVRLPEPDRVVEILRRRGGEGGGRQRRSGAEKEGAEGGDEGVVGREGEWGREAAGEGGVEEEGGEGEEAEGEETGGGDGEGEGLGTALAGHRGRSGAHGWAVLEWANAAHVCPSATTLGPVAPNAGNLGKIIRYALRSLSIRVR